MGVLPERLIMKNERGNDDYILCDTMKKQKDTIKHVLDAVYIVGLVVLLELFSQIKEGIEVAV